MQWRAQPRSKVLGYVGYREGQTTDVGRLLQLQSGRAALQTSAGSIRTLAPGRPPHWCVYDPEDDVPDQDLDSVASLRSARTALGLSAEQFARLVQVQSGRTVRKWEAGERDVPGPVVVLIKALMESRAVRRYFGVRVEGDSTDNSG